MKRVPCPYLLLVVASLRGMRKKKWEGGREKNAKSQIFFPFLPIPYPFDARYAGYIVVACDYILFVTA